MAVGHFPTTAERTGHWQPQSVSYTAAGQAVRPQPSPGKDASCSHLVGQASNQPTLLWSRTRADVTGLTFHFCHLGLTSESSLDTSSFSRRHQYLSTLFLKSPHFTKNAKQLPTLPGTLLRQHRTPLLWIINHVLQGVSALELNSVRNTCLKLLTALV